MSDDIGDAIIRAFETCAEAQLRALRRLRSGVAEKARGRPKKGLSQVDMAYDILKKARGPLYVGTLLDRIHATFGVTVDRESLVSSLTKKVARGDRFVRVEKNTFGLKPESR